MVDLRRATRFDFCGNPPDASPPLPSVAPKLHPMAHVSLLLSLSWQAAPRPPLPPLPRPAASCNVHMMAAPVDEKKSIGQKLWAINTANKMKSARASHARFRRTDHHSAITDRFVRDFFTCVVSDQDW